MRVNTRVALRGKIGLGKGGGGTIGVRRASNERSVGRTYLLEDLPSRPEIDSYPKRVETSQGGLKPLLDSVKIVLVMQIRRLIRLLGCGSHSETGAS